MWQVEERWTGRRKKKRANGANQWNAAEGKQWREALEDVGHVVHLTLEAGTTKSHFAEILVAPLGRWCSCTPRQSCWGPTIRRRG